MPRQSGGVSFTPQWNFLGTGDTTTVQIYNSLNSTYSLMLTLPEADLRYAPIGGGGTTTNPITFNNGGAGAASGTTFDGSTARTISYNTIGALGASQDAANSIGWGGQGYTSSAVTSPAAILGYNGSNWGPVAPINARMFLGFSTTGDAITYNSTTGVFAGTPYGTGVASALGNNTGTAGSFVLFNGSLGTPSGGVATNLTGTAAGLTAGLVTNGVYTSGSYANPSWITAIPYSILSGTVPTWNQNTTGSAAKLTTARSLWNKTFDGSANVSGLLEINNTLTSASPSNGTWAYQALYPGSGIGGGFYTSGGGEMYFYLKNSSAVDKVVLDGGTGNATFSGAITASNLTSGTYTPTITAISGSTSSTTAYKCQYSRIGNIVTVFGRVDCTKSAGAGSIAVAVTLPIPSNLANASDLNGFGSSYANGSVLANVTADTAGDTATLTSVSVTASTSHQFFFSFSYEVI